MTITLTINELLSSLKPTESLAVNRKLNWVAVTREDGDTTKNVRLFKILENDLLEEVPYKDVRQIIVNAILDKIDPAKLARLIVTESVDMTIPDHVFALLERLSNTKAKVKARPGCVELCIGGKRGKNLHYRLL